ncbi:peptidoglycan-binding domain-containing protein [Streptomyces sp. cg35]|uniref:peptidoglycan-binding domain-containing protein n=1 Tax=Streptomyces sp. cg35 TaxID=3421650 RepID=UPI003D18068E
MKRRVPPGARAAAVVVGLAGLTALVAAGLWTTVVPGQKETGQTTGAGAGPAITPAWQNASPPATEPQDPSSRRGPSSSPAGSGSQRAPAPGASSPTAADDGGTAHDDHRPLRAGSRGSGVVDVQERLRQMRLYEGPVDGYYSVDVASAVARFQQARDIDETLGVYGPRTQAAVEAATPGV